MAAAFVSTAVVPHGASGHSLPLPWSAVWFPLSPSLFCIATVAAWLGSPAVYSPRPPKGGGILLTGEVDRISALPSDLTSHTGWGKASVFMVIGRHCEVRPLSNVIPPISKKMTTVYLLTQRSHVSSPWRSQRTQRAT